MQTVPATEEADKFLSRRDYQEILLARMAGGDLYANEDRIRFREVDMKLDRLRVACGLKPLYAEPSYVKKMKGNEHIPSTAPS